MKSRLKVLIICTLMMCMAVNVNVRAGSLTSTDGTKLSATVLGQKYYYYSTVYIDDEGFVMAATTVQTTDKTNKPVGYMGMRARLYNSSGVLKKCIRLAL